jgi:hypothetical protein
VHCHQGAVLGYDRERSLLEGMGLDIEVPDSGCCGMAGSFGYERGQRYSVSRDCGERVILPAVRAASTDTLIIADGFSCREQIDQGTGRRPLHLAQVLRLAAARRLEPAAAGRPPEEGCWERRPRSTVLLAAAGLTAAGGAVLAGRHLLGGRNG